MFFDVAPQCSFAIAQTWNDFDSAQELRVGGACLPGDALVACADDPDTMQFSWSNEGSAPLRVFFVVQGAFPESEGAFEVAWTAGGGAACGYLPDPTEAEGEEEELRSPVGLVLACSFALTLSALCGLHFGVDCGRCGRVNLNFRLNWVKVYRGRRDRDDGNSACSLCCLCFCACALKCKCKCLARCAPARTVYVPYPVVWIVVTPPIVPAIPLLPIENVKAAPVVATPVAVGTVVPPPQMVIATRVRDGGEANAAEETEQVRVLRKKLREETAKLRKKQEELRRMREQNEFLAAEMRRKQKAHDDEIKKAEEALEQKLMLLVPGAEDDEAERKMLLDEHELDKQSLAEKWRRERMRQRDNMMKKVVDRREARKKKRQEKKAVRRFLGAVGSMIWGTGKKGARKKNKKTKKTQKKEEEKEKKKENNEGAKKEEEVKKKEAKKDEKEVKPKSDEERAPESPRQSDQQRASSSSGSIKRVDSEKHLENASIEDQVEFMKMEAELNEKKRQMALKSNKNKQAESQKAKIEEALRMRKMKRRRESGESGVSTNQAGLARQDTR